MKKIGYIDGRRMRFLDDYLLPFGTGEDITIGWDGASLNILPLTDNIGVVRFGNGVRDIDVVIYLGETWSHVLFDNSEQRVYFEAARARFTGATHLEFWDDAVYICAVSDGIITVNADIQIGLVAPLNTVFGTLMMDGAQRLQFQSADEAIFSAAPGIMQIYALTQIGLNAPLSTVFGILMMDGSQQIHFFTDAARIYAGAVGKLIIQATSGDYDAIHISGNVRFMDGDIQMDFLPPADPGVVNRLWNNAGVLSVS